MGMGYRVRQTPDGQQVPIHEYQDYMQNTYYPQQNFNAAVNAPIPGVTGPLGNSAQIPGVGIAPPQQPIPYQPQTSQFQPSGPYGQQAAALAGLLSQSAPSSPGMPNAPSPGAPMGDTYPNGLLGGKRPFRPGGK
jgi:hypothetical protein